MVEIYDQSCMISRLLLSSGRMKQLPVLEVRYYSIISAIDLDPSLPLGRGNEGMMLLKQP
jgi:hypothetical protein